MIEVKNITKTFGNTKALDNLSFTVSDGRAFGLLGRNGAGKTTCIRIIMNIFGADEGEALINGESAKKNKFKIGYLPEERGLYPNKVILDQMIYIGKLRGLTKTQAKDNAIRLLEELDASEYLNKKLSTLSKGNQQKIQLAISLINDPDIIILDEPFSGLDPVNAKLLKDMVTQQVALGRTVIFSSHQMSQVEAFCDDICIIDKGRNVLEGNLLEIKKSYPRNKVLIEARNINLESMLAGEISVRSITPKGLGFIVDLENAADKDYLFKILEEKNVSVDVFAVLEPSLEDIFVEKVGGELVAEDKAGDH